MHFKYAMLVLQELNIEKDRLSQEQLETAYIATAVVNEARRLLKINPTAQPGTRGNVVLALPRFRGVRGFGRDLFHTLLRTSP